MNWNATHPSPQSRAPKRPAEPKDRSGNDRLDEDELIDMQSNQSFPASDPPGWTLGTTRAH